MHRCLRLVRLALWAGGAALVAFHGWLLAGQAAAGRLAEPGVAFRWLLAAALVASLVALRQSRRSIRGRQGIAVWVLAALLHGPAVVAAGSSNPDALAFPDAVAVVVVQIGAAAGSLALGLWILGWLLRADTDRRVPRLAVAETTCRRRSHQNCRPFSPRPPPRL
jgi:hypothetical protein